MEKNIGTFNIAYGIRLYETIKKDLYTLLVKESKEVFDYEGDVVEMEADRIEFEYEPSVAFNMDYVVRTWSIW